MALPFSGLKHVLAVDDVVPAELVQAVVDKCNDAVDLMAAEHVVSGGDAGLHDVIPIPVAVCMLDVPTQAEAAQERNLSVRFSKGFVGAPRWRVYQREDYQDPTKTITAYSIELSVPSSVFLWGASCGSRHTISGASYDVLVFPHVYVDGNKLTIRVENVSELDDVDTLLVAAFGERD